MGQRLDNATNLYVEGIRDGHFEQAITEYTGSRYTQHSGGVKDGREGFIEFFSNFVERNPNRDIKIVRGFEDGQYVFVQAHQILNDGEFEYVTADIFDTDDDDAKIIEHWDVIAELSGDSASGQSQIDGPTEPTDLHKTEQNKSLVRRYLDDVLVNGNIDRAADYLSANSYVEHNPTAGTPLRYLKVHKLIGSGDFVATLSHVDMGGTDTAIIDLFRVADDKVVEHRNVIEEIAPKDQWANSGKF